jgi:hypothetical protein
VLANLQVTFSPFRKGRAVYKYNTKRKKFFVVGN